MLTDRGSSSSSINYILTPTNLIGQCSAVTHNQTIGYRSCSFNIQTCTTTPFIDGTDPAIQCLVSLPSLIN